MDTLTAIKTFIESVKLLKDLFVNKSDNKSDDKSDVIMKKFKTLENDLRNFKQDTEIKEQESFNDVQLRLKKLFNSHGIDDNLICQFVINVIDKDFVIPVSKLTDLALIFDKFTDKHIDKLVDVFGINKGWIYSQGDLYPYKNFYKDIESLITFIYEKNKTEKLEGFAFRTGDFNYLDEKNHQPLYVLIRTPLITMFDKTIYRYYPIHTDWKWDYWKTRYQIKSLFNLFETTNNYIDFNGRTVTMDELDIIASRNNCPDEIIRNQRQNTWYPYDYSTTIERNSMARELEETQNIIDYIESQGYNRFLKNTIANKV